MPEIELSFITTSISKQFITAWYTTGSKALAKDRIHVYYYASISTAIPVKRSGPAPPLNRIIHKHTWLWRSRPRAPLAPADDAWLMLLRFAVIRGAPVLAAIAAL